MWEGKLSRHGESLHTVGTKYWNHGDIPCRRGRRVFGKDGLGISLKAGSPRRWPSRMSIAIDLVLTFYIPSFFISTFQRFRYSQFPFTYTTSRRSGWWSSFVSSSVFDVLCLWIINPNGYSSNAPFAFPPSRVANVCVGLDYGHFPPS